MENLRNKERPLPIARWWSLFWCHATLYLLVLHVLEKGHP